jgi:mannose/fructose/N-acetylgalactosamine-specific phosphotransferase system component IIC
MIREIVVFGLFGGIVLVDSKAAWQTMISQPLVACTLGGLICGDVMTGWLVGLIFQLPYLTELPVGSARLSLTNLSAYVSAGVTANMVNLYPDKSTIVLFLTCLCGFLLSYGGVPIRNWLRGVNLFLCNRARAVAGEDKLQLRKISYFHYLGAANAFLTGCLITAFAFFVLGEFVRLVVAPISDAVNDQLRLFKPVILGAGVGAMLAQFENKTTRRPIISGVLVSMTVFLFVWVLR